MATPILQKRDNDRYYACWTEDRRSFRKSMGTSNRDLAEARFAQWLLIGGHRAATEDPESAGSALTVAECWQVYDEKHVRKNVAASATMGFSWKALEPHFGRLLVAQVDQDQVDLYVTKRTSGRLGRKVKPQTCRKELSALFAALRFCAAPAQRLIPATAIAEVELPEEGDPRDRWLTIEEMQALLDAAAAMRRGDRLSRGERFLWIALETAARKQAIFDLTWDRVDFETGTIHFDVPGRKRTKKRRVSVAMSSALRPVLRRAYDERESELVMDNKAEIWATIQWIVGRAGIAGKQPKIETSQKPRATGVSPHVLRHTAATHMARRGVPLWKIANILGNTLAMTEKVYAKWAPEDPGNTVDLISAGRLRAVA